jgi:hypothetical protein
MVPMLSPYRTEIRLITVAEITQLTLCEARLPSVRDGRKTQKRILLGAAAQIFGSLP